MVGEVRNVSHPSRPPREADGVTACGYPADSQRDNRSEIGSGCPREEEARCGVKKAGKIVGLSKAPRPLPDEDKRGVDPMGTGISPRSASTTLESMRGTSPGANHVETVFIYIVLRIHRGAHCCPSCRPGRKQRLLRNWDLIPIPAT